MKSQVLFFYCLILCLISFPAHALLKQGTGAIYGLDDRISIEDEDSAEVKRLSQSVALIFHNDLLTTGRFSSKIAAISLSENVNVCPAVKFKNELTLNGCSGFLIAPDLLVSAGHCFATPEDCTDKSIAFDVETSNQRSDHYKVSNRNIYKCKEVVATSYSEELDYALIRLERKTKRPPLKMRPRGQISASESVFMLGHAMGQPLKKSQAAMVGDIQHHLYFKAPLDAFAGNSGSPVINARTLLVEGILVRGQEDFLLDHANQCYRYQVYGSAGGEGITRIREILPFLKN